MCVYVCGWQRCVAAGWRSEKRERQRECVCVCVWMKVAVLQWNWFSIRSTCMNYQKKKPTCKIRSLRASLAWGPSTGGGRRETALHEIIYISGKASCVCCCKYDKSVWHKPVHCCSHRWVLVVLVIWMTIISQVTGGERIRWPECCNERT